MTPPALIFAHGVGRVYESPIPVWLYFFGAALTVLASFLVRALAGQEKPIAPEKQIASANAARIAAIVLKALGIAFFVLALAVGILTGERGPTLTTFIFWVAGVVGITSVSAIVDGVWGPLDPWRTTDSWLRVEDDRKDVTAPPWLAPVLLYLLFWFELVSGVGFDSFWVVLFLIGLSVLSFVMRGALGEGWTAVDPLSVLFSFAGRGAPFALRDDGVFRRHPVSRLDEDRPMPLGLYASVFVLLAATSFDNVRETTGWYSFMQTIGADALPAILRDSIALLLFTLPFLLTFRLAVAGARFQGVSGDEAARRIGWSLVPIAVAYVLAHNAPLLLTGIPQLVSGLSDPFLQGWNLLGTRDLFEGYQASPKLAWFLEVILIVGGHILAVLAAHRAALRIEPDRRAAISGQYALTALMSIYTIATLWLLSQPLVS